MRITFKPLLLLFSIAFTMLLALPLALLFVDVDSHRAPIERLVSAAFGREVVFEGPITLEPSLTPRLTIEGLKISNPAWASRPFLATVERFKIQAELLPLLEGELEIQALEFHGVDLRLEDGPDGNNNYTFGSSERPGLLPAIEHLLLYDAELSWLPLGGAEKSHHLQHVRARKVPGQPVELELTGTLFDLPMQFELRGEPRGHSWPFGPWESTLQGNIGDISIRLSGSIPKPIEWYRGNYQFEVQADSMRQLTVLKNLGLSETGALMLGGGIRFNLNEYLVISDLHGGGVNGDVNGSIRWELAELRENPVSWQQLLASAELELRALSGATPWQRELTVGNQETRLTVSEVEVRAGPQSPLVLTAQATLDDRALAVNLQAEPLANLLMNSEFPWQVLALNVSGEGLQVLASGSVSSLMAAREFDIRYTLEGDRFADKLGLSGDFKLRGRYRNLPDKHLFYELSARIADLEIDGRMTLHLAAGQLLPGLANGAGLDVAGVLSHVELDLETKIPGGLLDEPIRLAGRTLVAEVSTVKIRALPGETVKLNASASLNGKPMQLSLRGETLAALAERPAGPWRDLLLDGEGQDFRFAVQGEVARPLRAEGLDVDFELEGGEIDALLPLVDLVLPLQGAHSLSGHFAHTPEGMLFDELQIRLGRSDISGRVLLIPGKQRPRLEAELSSDLIYLTEFLWEQEVDADVDANAKVIPDFELPIKRMRELDGKLHFTSKYLDTSATQFGDVSFTMSLEDQKLRLDDFQIQGGAGGLMEATAAIDASQDPPTMSLRLSSSELNYGALLEQTGLAESVEGALDVTLRLTGEGSNRSDILRNARGQLIVVGEQGRFGSRRLDLWGSDLVTTMLSPAWHREDVTELNCVVAHVGIEEGVASTDKFLIDTPRITIGASGTLNLDTEELNLVVAPQPKRTSLVSLTSPAYVTGTLAAPQVSATVLPRTRATAAGGALLAGLLNPSFLVFTFSQLGTQDSNPCVTAIDKVEAMKPDADG